MTTATKTPAIDLVRELHHLYAPPTTPEFIDVPPRLCVMVDGEGDPNTSPAYHDALAALYALAYGLKFALKRAPGGADYKVMPLEGLWWSDEMADFLTANRAGWRWTMLIPVPDAVTPELFEQVRAKAMQDKPEVQALAHARLERFAEGRCAQVMHLGPYSAEGPTIARLHAFIREQGATFDDPALKHHEIYLGDPRRTKPEKLKTVLRQPVAG